eukprot:CAMPEP_0177769938 /NCGR_PEP_ID=MMETSP0491_2-20121128/10627_1 /TAXON_ID=63592 /ORGANISM="Tetraselmis chuii, Strain PLY429" /LENGTH=593 /DNA_ID=CAMNT_0019287057 /DNA_START=106 /DNA_END=1887 /DNA_ORIENTATION=+
MAPSATLAGAQGVPALRSRRAVGVRASVGPRPTLAHRAVKPLQAAPLTGTTLPSLRPSRQVFKAAATPPAVVNAAAADEPEKKFLGQSTETLAKIIPLGLMFFCILFNYTILRDTKDVLVVTAPGSGAEIIPFLKTWVNLPAAIGFAAVYATLSNWMSTQQLFFTCLIPFVIFFGSFAYILYPLRDVLHPTQFCIDLLDKAGERFAGPIAILRNWTFCVFYVMAELWGSVVVSVLFWGFANQITKVEEAEQFYPLFGLGANVALIFSGRAVYYFSQVRASLPPGVDGWEYSLKGLMSMVVIGGVIIGGIYAYMQKTIVAKQAALAPKKKKKKKKANLSLGESVAFLAKSEYIRCLALLVVSYGISINLVEVTWKAKIKAQYPNPNDYSAFMGNFSSCTGAVTFCLMIFGRFVFQRFGWRTAALFTPSILLITGLLFFALVLCSGPLTPMLAALGFTPLYAAVLVGAAQNIFSKGSKYSLFDPCKEMAYIPLDIETQLKGKAAIDVICNPLGKSGGALIQQGLIIGFGSLAASTPYLGGILLVIVLTWITAANRLAILFKEKNEEKLLEDLNASESEDEEDESPTTPQTKPSSA